MGVQPVPAVLNGNAFGWGYATSPDHGNAWDSGNIRGLFNRLGATISFPMVTDGLSNTIAVGESLPSQHDHLAQNIWWHFNGGNAHCTTIIPINYQRTSSQYPACGNPLDHYANWNKSWGFKSNHANGANFLFADGSVHYLPAAIDTRTYALLGCRNDNLAVTIP